MRMVVRPPAAPHLCALRSPAAKRAAATAAADDEADDVPRRLETERCNKSPLPRNVETAAAGLEAVPGKVGREEEEEEE